MEKLIEWDRDLFLFLNGLHSPWLDQPMFILTHTQAWIPLYAVLLYFIVKEHKKRAWIFLIGITITIVLADQITSSVLKPYFTRFRPSRDPELQQFVHIVNGYRGGRYGFASSHAANTFGTATFLFLLFRRTKRWMVWIFLWAAFISYTRIYLGVHYPADILVGATIGAVCGWLSLNFSVWLNTTVYKEEITPL